MASLRMLVRYRFLIIVSLLFTVVFIFYFNILYQKNARLTSPIFESKSIVVESNRREYYILNKEFFEFLSRTSMECLIRVEPDELWNGEARVRTKLIDNHILYDEHSSTVSNNLTVKDLENIPTHRSETSERKYILVYHHFEQLGKTTENLLQLAALAGDWSRIVVEPEVKNSRFYMHSEPNAYPIETYYNIINLNVLLQANGYSKLVKMRHFRQDCNFRNHGAKTTLVHFLYSDVHKGNTKLWFGKNDKDVGEIVRKTLSSGWTDCNFIRRHLTGTKALEGIEIGRQVCVNPEILRDIKEFEQKVLLGDKCVIFTEWRGLGKQRTHFHPIFWPFLTPADLKHRILLSDIIRQETASFIERNLPKKFISVHIRTERLFVANLYKKLHSCVDHVLHLVNILRSLRNVSTVFLATDMVSFGSDLFDRRKFSIKNVTGEYLISREDITDIHHDIARRLNAVTYQPSHNPFTNDKGIFSLVELSILKNGIDLVTLGSGTFHAWIVSAFQHNQIEIRRSGYTISEICGSENY